jgi:hypothetical protein
VFNSNIVGMPVKSHLSSLCPELAINCETKAFTTSRIHGKYIIAFGSSPPHSPIVTFADVHDVIPCLLLRLRFDIPAVPVNAPLTMSMSSSVEVDPSVGLSYDVTTPQSTPMRFEEDTAPESHR